MMAVERYSHVMHICSKVDRQAGRRARTPSTPCGRRLPVGTVSGAPKVRAMQIIDEFEPTRRGPYAGAVGYVDFAGNMDTCIALRTMVITPGRRLRQERGLRAGRRRHRGRLAAGTRVQGDHQQGQGPAAGHRDRRNRLRVIARHASGSSHIGTG